jgi:DNA-binding GntR family transcriptional regulator
MGGEAPGPEARAAAEGPPAGSLLKERAYEKIKTLIQSGAFTPGRFLSERQLARALGMSKTPVHSALERLDNEGFVAVSPQQGIVVRDLSVQEIIDILRFRTALETYVVRSLAGRLTAAQEAKLRRNLAAQDECIRKGDGTGITVLDAGFHLLLCEFLDNREILLAMRRLREKLHRILLRVNRGTAAGHRAVSSREHARIAEAVIRGRGAAAARLMARHLEFGQRLMLSK